MGGLNSKDREEKMRDDVMQELTRNMGSTRSGLPQFVHAKELTFLNLGDFVEFGHAVDRYSWSNARRIYRPAYCRTLYQAKDWCKDQLDVHEPKDTLYSYALMHAKNEQGDEGHLSSGVHPGSLPMLEVGVKVTVAHETTSEFTFAVDVPHLETHRFKSPGRVQEALLKYANENRGETIYRKLAAREGGVVVGLVLANGPYVVSKQTNHTQQTTGTLKLELEGLPQADGTISFEHHSSSQDARANGYVASDRVIAVEVLLAAKGHDGTMILESATVNDLPPLVGINFEHAERFQQTKASL